MIDPTAIIHGLVNLHANVSLGAQTTVWPFASVIRGARIGAHCSIATCAIVDGSRLGDNCIVSHGAFIDPGIEICDDVFIGPFVALCNDRWPRVDKDGFDMPGLIAGTFVTTIIESCASIGASAVVLPGIVIGHGAMVAAHATVHRNVPPGHLFKRDGTSVPVVPPKPEDRMRRARADWWT